MRSNFPTEALISSRNMIGMLNKLSNKTKTIFINPQASIARYFYKIVSVD